MIKNREKLSYVQPSFIPNNANLTAECGKNFFHYLKRFNLFKETDLIVLPSNHHYYYDESDFKSIRTLINLKKLNLIKDRDKFFHTLFLILPPDVNFIGCFSAIKTLKGNRFISRLSNRLNNFLDSRTDHNIDKKYVIELLEKYGFKVVDMSEMNGLTYFYSQNILRSFQKIA
jgi:hypothetical protein